MTTATKKKLWKAQYLKTTNTTLYTAPQVTRCEIAKVVLVNTDASTTYDATIYLNVNGETGGNEAAITLNVTVQPEESKTVTELTGMVLEPQDKIVAQANVADKITIHGSGTELA